MASEYEDFKQKIVFAIEMQDMSLLSEQIRLLSFQTSLKDASFRSRDLLDWAILNLKTEFKPFHNVIYVDFKNKKKVS